MIQKTLANIGLNAITRSLRMGATSTLKVGASYVAVSEIVDFAADYSDFVKENRDFIVIALSLGSTGLASSGIKSVGGAIASSPLKAWLATTASAAGASLARRVPIALSKSKQMYGGKPATVFTASFRGKKGTTTIDAILLAGEKKIAWRSSNPILLPLLLAIPIGGSAALIGGDEEAENDFGLSLGVVAAELSANLELTSLRRDVALQTNLDILTSLRSLVEGYRISYPSLSEDLITSVLMNSLQAVEENDGSVIYEFGVTEDDQEILRVNGQQYILDEDGTLIFAPGESVASWGKAGEKSSQVAAAITGMISEYLALGEIPFASAERGGDFSVPVVVDNYAAYIVRTPLENPDPEDAAELDELGVNVPVGSYGYLYYLAARETTISEELVSTIADVTGGFIDFGDISRTGIFDASKLEEAGEGDYLGQGLNLLGKLYDGTEDGLLGLSSFVNRKAVDGWNFVSNKISTLTMSEEQETKVAEAKKRIVAAASAGTSARGIIGSPVTVSSKTSTATKEENIVRNFWDDPEDGTVAPVAYSFGQSIPILRAMGLSL